MKISEFIKKVNQFAAANEDGDCIYIAETEDELESGLYLFMIYPKGPIMLKRWNWNLLVTVPPKKLQKLFSLADELERTPVKERFSKKKYTVQVLNDSKSFLNKGRCSNHCFLGEAIEDVVYQSHFTQAEIDELKQRDDIAIDWDKAIVKEVD